MSVQFLRDGREFDPEGAQGLRAFCDQTGIGLIMEWKEGQFWLGSDRPNERPIGLAVDQELERHVAYFKKSSLHKELLARAVGIKGSFRPRVLDLTAGLLGDSLLLLSMGCEVRAVERHPVVAFLVKSALENAAHPLLKKFSFEEKEARVALEETLSSQVIFYDPMFEDANHKSLPRKEMRIFRGLVGEDGDGQEVFKQALALGKKRLVVKRPRLSVPIVPGNPLQYVGKATRYDVYLGHGPNESNHIE